MHRAPTSWTSRVCAWALLLATNASAQGVPPAPAEEPVEVDGVMTGAVQAPAPAPAAPPAPAPSPAPLPPAQPPPGPYYPQNQAPAGPYYPPARPVMVEPPKEEPGRHLHDGFYLRMALGGGALAATYESSTAAGAEAEVGGGGVGIDLWLGGTPWPGLVIGGAITGNSAANPRVETSAGSSSADKTNLSATMLGLFVDGFPDPEGGLHIGGMLGLATLTYTDKDNDEERRHGGGGAALWVGYAGWIGSDWSLGGMLRGTVQATENEDSDLDEQARARSLSIMLTALYH